MRTFRKLATASAIAVVGLGAGAVGASAYSISGGAYTATASADHSATIGGSYTVSCQTPTFSGTATGSATTSFTPVFSTCEFFGYQTDFTLSGAWELTVIAGPDGAGYYSARVDIPTGSSVTASVPLVGCDVYNDGPQSFSDGVGGSTIRLRNTLGGMEVTADAYGITYTTNGACPFSNGSDGEYHTNGTVLFPGITVS